MSIDFHRLVKPIDIINFYRFNCLYLLVSMIDFHRLGMPGFNQGHSSGSNNSLIRYQHHVWREQFRESRETFQETFEHIVFVSLASTPKQALKNNFFRLFQHLAGVCHNAQRDWLRYLSGQVTPSRVVVYLFVIFRS